LAKKSSGKDTHPFTPKIAEGKIPRFEGKNDHGHLDNMLAFDPSNG